MYFGISERLRAFRYPIFTGGVVEENGICSATFCESAALLEKLQPAFSRLTRYVTIFPSQLLCVKMRLERSAERDKRKNKNNLSAIYAQSEAEGIQNRPSCKRSRRTSSVQRLLLMVAYFRLKVAGSKSGSSQLRVMISVRSFRMAMECSKWAASPPSLVLTVQPSLSCLIL